MLLANDMDIDGDTLTITGVHSVRFGTASLDGGNVKFTPSANFNGSATLLYTVSDGEATAPGVLTLSVGTVNDPPIAGDDYFNTDEDTPLTIESFQLLGTDSDVELENLTVTAVSNPQNCTVTFANDIITFTPAANFNGDATFDYSVTDGTSTVVGKVTVTVGAVNDAPVARNDATTTTRNTAKVLTVAALLANDTDAEMDALTVTGVSSPVNGTVNKNGNNITFTPTNAFTGAARFTYTITDGTATATATVNITVTN
jgi:large repetitive protein